jgi:hypothetical protein
LSSSFRWLVIAVVAWGAFAGLAIQRYPTLLVPLGSPVWPTFGYAALGGIWGIYGTFAALALTMALAHLAAEGGAGERLAERWRGVSDRAFVVAISVAATLGALATRRLVLGGAAITDDEAAYRFAAQLLASGRLWVDSPPMKLFFDHGFLLNDGRLQSMYFLGWPALQVPGIWLGIPGAMNALYFGLTVPAVFFVARRLLGSDAARVAALLFAASPFLLALAATELSHTTSLLALAWTTLLFLASRDPGATWRVHAGLATAFSVAVFVRPITAAGLGAVLLPLWAFDRLRERRGRVAALAAFALPAALGGGLFLAAQNAQHGSPLRTGYHHSIDYLIENEYRFATRAPSPQKAPGMEFDQIGVSYGRMASGLFALGLDLHGWPVGLLAAAPALIPGAGGFVWVLGAGGLLGVVFDRVVGVDSFGPVHYSEIALPLVLLLAAGWREAARGAAAARFAATDWRRWAAPAALVALTLTAWGGYVPLRWYNLAQMADSILAPTEAVEAANLSQAVVFAPFPWVRSGCQPYPANHFRFQRPVPGPDLDDDVLWINHVDLETDRALMAELFPTRKGYAVLWAPGCEIVVLPLDEATEETLPKGRLSTIG